MRAAGSAVALGKRAYVGVRRTLRRGADLARLAAAKAGPWRVECPICGWRFREFLPHGLQRRENARCPRCSSLERQRLMYLYLQRRTDFFDKSLRVLHFAPEPYFMDLGSRKNLEVVTADLDYPFVDVNLDITGLPMRDGTFDVVICSHVLEHVPDDIAAMREIHRVLKPGGWAVLMVPYERDRAETFEDPSITDAAERERLFGQYDHVRLYGRDYADRLRGAGFDVTEDELAREVDRYRYGLMDEPIHICTRPLGHAEAGSGAGTANPKAATDRGSSRAPARSRTA